MSFLNRDLSGLRARSRDSAGRSVIDVNIVSDIR
jgi:hypothetical protein